MPKLTAEQEQALDAALDRLEVPDPAALDVRAAVTALRQYTGELEAELERAADWAERIASQLGQLALQPNTHPKQRRILAKDQRMYRNTAAAMRATMALPTDAPGQSGDAAHGIVSLPAGKQH